MSGLARMYGIRELTKVEDALCCLSAHLRDLFEKNFEVRILSDLEAIKQDIFSLQADLCREHLAARYDSDILQAKCSADLDRIDQILAVVELIRNDLQVSSNE